MADSVGLALLVVLETLSPRRAARVRPARHVRGALRRDRHDPRPLPAATRQLASRARRRVRARPRPPTPTSTRQREVVDAFLAAARDGDFEALARGARPGRRAPGRRRRRLDRLHAESSAARRASPGRPPLSRSSASSPARAHQRRARRRHRPRRAAVLGRRLHRPQPKIVAMNVSPTPSASPSSTRRSSTDEVVDYARNGCCRRGSITSTPKRPARLGGDEQMSPHRTQSFISEP